MENPRDDLASVLERLAARMDEIESRIATLEQHPQSNGFAGRLPPSPVLAESHPLAQLSSVRPPSAGVAVGRLFLGIAGGYLLRALAESGALPPAVMVLLALTYATAWLVWAARVPSEARFASAASAMTAALIFCPMIWELTVRFKILPDAPSAGALAAFAALAWGLAWKRKLATLAWIATVFPAVTALVLLVATRDPAPFACALLFMALLTEYASLHGRWRSLRPLVALLADCAILVLVLVYSGQEQVPPEYKPVSPAALAALASGLFAIYGAGIALSTVLRRQRIGVFEIAQTMAAFVLGASNVLRMTHDAAAPYVGAFCLLLAGACYLVAVVCFDYPGQARNYHVFAAWAAVLLVVGSLFLFSAAGAGLCLSAAAVVATFFAARSGRWIFGFHGALYLAAAGYLSGVWEYAARALAGPLPAYMTWNAWATVASAILCCGAVWWKSHNIPPRMQSLLRLLFSSATTCIAMALAVTGIVGIISGGAPAPILAVVRTLVLCAAIVLLIITGARWDHVEVIWIAYAAIAFCTSKLLFEDLRHGATASLAASLFLYGVMWVLVPRLLRSERQPT